MKYINNWAEVLKYTDEKYETLGIPLAEYDVRNDSIMNLARQHAIYNNEQWEKAAKERLTLYEVETITIPLYHLGDRLHDKMAQLLLVYSFNTEMRTMILDGYSSIFRCVTDEELWTLTIHMPRSRALQMSNLCRQMIEDAANDRFDEWKYVRMLEPIEF